jgi:hypothetical protein
MGSEVTLRHRAGRAPIAAALLVSVVLLGQLIWPGTTSGHNLNYCGDYQTIRWSSSGTTHYYPSSWEAGLLTAIANAQTNFNTSDFDYTKVGITSALVTWVDLGAEWQVAGTYYVYVNCGTHIIGSGTIKMNLPHFSHDIHTTAQKQCTAIHEMAHIPG